MEKLMPFDEILI